MAVRAPATPSSASEAFHVSAVASRVSLESRAPSASNASGASSASSYYTWKRVADVVISATLLALASPVMLLAAAAVSLNTPGPVLFRQRRVGENGEEFEILKFRSMRHNVSSKLHQDAIKAYMAGEKLNNASGAKTPYKLASDMRITRVGKFIRKTSIDELPQLWNVLMGQMSMVGPRPPVPYEVKQYDLRAMERLRGKPGITGPWQVYGRNKVTFSEMVELDIAYFEKHSIMYDLKLIALTAPVAIFGGV